jgi:hypothetical protein
LSSSINTFFHNSIIVTDVKKAAALALRSHQDGWRWGMCLLMGSHPGGVFKHPSRLPPKLPSRRATASDPENDEDANRHLCLGGLEDEEVV